MGANGGNGDGGSGMMSGGWKAKDGEERLFFGGGGEYSQHMHVITWSSEAAMGHGAGTSRTADMVCLLGQQMALCVTMQLLFHFASVCGQPFQRAGGFGLVSNIQSPVK